MITINNIGCQFVNVGGINLNRPNGTGDYLLLFLRTNAEILMKDHYVPIKAGNFYLFPKNAPQIYRKLDGTYINDWMHFNIKPDNGYFDTLDIPLLTPIQLHNHAPINDMMYDIFAEFFNTGAHHVQIMDQKANALFQKFSDIYHIEKSSCDTVNKYRMNLTELRKQIYNYELIPENIGEIAKSMNMSLSYFEHMYKQLFQVSISQDIIKARISHACTLLNGTDYTITQVASMCNYENLEHFSRQFKKVMGISPRKYRASKNQA